MRELIRWYLRADEGGGGAPVVEEGVDDRSGGAFDWGEQASEEYAKRFPGGPQEMWKAIGQGTQKITQLTQAEQRAQELEAELEEFRAQAAEREGQWEDPLAQLPTGVDEATMAKLVAVFQTDPARAFDMAAQAAPGYGPGLQNQMFTAWLSRDPIAAMDHLVNSRISPVLDERFQSFEDQLSDRLGPTLAHSVEQMSTAAVLTSRTMAPDITQYEDRIEAAILGNPALIADVIGNVQQSAERLVQLRDMIWAADQRAAATKQAAPPVEGEGGAKKEQQQPSRRPRQSTMSRSDAEAPQLVDDDYAKRMSIPKDRQRGRGAA